MDVKIFYALMEMKNKSPLVFINTFGSDTNFHSNVVNPPNPTFEVVGKELYKTEESAIKAMHNMTKGFNVYTIQKVFVVLKNEEDLVSE